MPFDDYKKRGWVCKKCGNKWTAKVYLRYNGTGKCLKCRSIGINKPELLNEWDAEANFPLTPYNVTPGSHKKVAWICSKCNNRWIAIIKNRYYGHGCPFCKLEKTSLDRSRPNAQNNLALNHKLSSQLHPTKNKNLKPIDICLSSNKRLWWKCNICNWEWQSACNIRVRSKYQLCPKCPKPIPRAKSLAFLEPDIASEFYMSKNPHVTPSNISLGNRWIIQWKCSKCGYLYFSDTQSRVKGRNCPNCCDKIILKNGVKCASLIEAYYYLLYKMEGKEFLHNGKYGGLGKLGNCRYDFYFPSEHLYVEVTSFQSSFKKWFSYLRRIVKKKHYVENVLKGKFLFINDHTTAKQVRYINSNRRKYKSK